MKLTNTLMGLGIVENELEDILSMSDVGEFAQNANSIGDAHLHKTEPTKTKQSAAIGFYDNFSQLRDAELTEAEELLRGIKRKQVSLVVSSTNVGKTTLMLNSLLAASSGSVFDPLLPEHIAGTPRKVAYFDFESTGSELRADIQRMLRLVKDSEVAENNFSTIIDAKLSDECFNFSNRLHLLYAINYCTSHQIDIVVIDTISAAFNIFNENDNAEVKRKIMAPLKELAETANCAVIAIHHIGKQRETEAKEQSYLGRGASAFGALSRTVYTLSRDNEKGEGYVVLSQAKTKGKKIEPRLLHLDNETRWFSLCTEKPTPKYERLTADDVQEYVASNPSRRKDIIAHFSEIVSERTVNKCITNAEALGKIHKESRNGIFTVYAQTDDVTLDF